MRFVFRAATGLLLTGLLAGCSAPPAETPASARLAANDFENLDGWLADSPALATLTQEQAHSGRYSTRVSGGHDFGLGYSNTLARLAPEWPARLTVGAWVLLSGEQATGQLVMEIKNPGTATANLLWEGLELAQHVKVFNKWRYVEHTITLPAAARPDSRLLVYLWRANSRQPVYLDDLTISLARP